MAVDIQPGSTVRIKVTKTPNSEGAAKTLSRLFAKDPVNKKLRVRRKKLRTNAMEVRRRGGRPWEVRQKAPRLVQPMAGATCSIRATTDVIGDLNSVARFIEVSSK
jgi:hypothetical protein